MQTSLVRLARRRAYSWPVSGMERVVVRKAMTTPDRDVEYWQSRPVEERIEAFVEWRREFEGWTVETEPSLPRVVRVIRPQ